MTGSLLSLDFEIVCNVFAEENKVLTTAFHADIKTNTNFLFEWKIQKNARFIKDTLFFQHDLMFVF